MARSRLVTSFRTNQRMANRSASTAENENRSQEERVHRVRNEMKTQGRHFLMVHLRAVSRTFTGSVLPK